MLYDTFDVVGLRHERLDLAGGRSLSGTLIAQQLGRASRVIVAVCTVGERLSRYASEVGRTDSVRSMALDGLASAAAQELAESACQRFEALASRDGLVAGFPLNPGMVGWTLFVGASADLLPGFGTSDRGRADRQRAHDACQIPLVRPRLRR